MIHIVKPDYYIKIGIKNKKVVTLDWGESFHFEKYKNNIQMKKLLIRYLKEAIKRITNVDA